MRNVTCAQYRIHALFEFYADRTTDRSRVALDRVLFNSDSIESALVGGLEHFLFFHILGIVTPTDELHHFSIFLRGVGQPPTRTSPFSNCCAGWYSCAPSGRTPGLSFNARVDAVFVQKYAGPSPGPRNGMTYCIQTYYIYILYFINYIYIHI